MKYSACIWMLASALWLLFTTKTKAEILWEDKVQRTFRTIANNTQDSSFIRKSYAGKSAARGPPHEGNLQRTSDEIRNGHSEKENL